MEKEIYDSFVRLNKKFENIKSIGFVKGINNYNSGSGATFEKLIGKDNENFSYADFDGIELKTKIDGKDNLINLFKLNPEGTEFYESKRLIEKYGYISKDDNTRKLYIKVALGKKYMKNSAYSYSLKINYLKKIIQLVIYNEENEMIDNTSYWSFEKLNDVIERKLKYLALVKVDREVFCRQYYYYYKEINYYKFISFNNFIKAIENGEIIIVHYIDTYKTGNRIGQPHDHGAAFQIDIKDINSIYEEIKL